MAVLQFSKILLTIKWADNSSTYDIILFILRAGSASTVMMEVLEKQALSSLEK